MLSDLKKELKSLSNKEYAKVLQRFFKTGKGEYGEGDIFLGIKSKPLTSIIKRYNEMNLKEVQKLLNSRIHEHKSAALIILKEQFNKGNEHKKKQIYDFYIKNSKKINNWDLVDISAPHIVGNYLLKKDRKILYKLAKSKNLWEKRISIISTLSFIKEDNFEDTLFIAKILLNDPHDLIHKAVGWMLREIGKKNQKIEENFLKKYYKIMPRTMLRYSIEKFEETKRQKYLKGLI